MQNNYGNITNNGALQTTSTTAGNGMHLINNYGTITNNGTIEAARDGIYLFADNNGDIINGDNGNITTSANNRSGIRVDNVNSSTATILSTGNITVNGDFGSGIYATGNDGDIENGGSITATGRWSSGIYLGSNGGTTTNSGNITTTGDDSYGIYIGYDNFSSGIITNTGNITTSGANSFGIYLYYTNRGIIENSGTIQTAVNGVLDYNSYSYYDYDLNGNGTFTNTNSGKMYGNIQANKLNNEGKIYLPYNAYNNTADLMSTTKSASIEELTNSGTIQIGLLTNGTTSIYSQLATDTATFNTGSILDVNVLSNSTNVDLLSGTTLADVVSATTSLTINDLTITDNSALLDFEYIEDGETIDLKAIKAQTVSSTIQADNSNAQAAAETLQNIIDNSGSYAGMNGVITALNGLSTNAQVASAVDSTTPQTTTSSFTASNQISNNVSNIVTQRQTIIMNSATGANSGDELLASKNMWVKPYGSYGSQQNKNGVNGFDISTYGIGIGFDGETKDNQQMGLGFFYTKADVDVNNVSQTSDIDVYSLILYGNTPVIDDKTHLLYQLGYSYQDTSSQRDIAFMSTSATADYKSHVASVDVKLLRDYQINDKVLLQPLVSTTYRYFKTPSYSETGAGALNLDVKDFSSSEFILGAGTLAYYEINNTSKLFGNVNVGYDLKDDNNIVSSSYQGASGLSFETKGIDNGRWSYDLGFGYENDITELSNLSFTYNFQGEGSDYTNHVVSAKYTFKF